MKIIESVRNYIAKLDCLATFEKAVNVNFLGGEVESFSIEEVPCNPVLKKYLDGSKRQFQFVFCSREPYGNEILQNIENSSFYEEFAREIEEKSYNGILPIMDNGLEPLKVEVTSSAYAVSVTEDTALFQINLNLKYYKKRG